MSIFLVGVLLVSAAESKFGQVQKKRFGSNSVSGVTGAATSSIGGTAGSSSASPAAGAQSATVRGSELKPTCKGTQSADSLGYTYFSGPYTIPGSLTTLRGEAGFVKFTYTPTSSWDESKNIGLFQTGGSSWNPANKPNRLSIFKCCVA